MLRPHGYFVCVDPDAPRGTLGTVECDIVSCSHCSTWIRVPAGKTVDDVGGRHCHTCDEDICKMCARYRTCTPVQMALSIIESPVDKIKARIREDEVRGRFLYDVFGVT